MPATGSHVFIDLPNGRIYEVKNVPGYPRGRNGRPVRILIDHDRQEVLQSSALPSCEAARIMQAYCGSAHWQLCPSAPIVGSVD
jgi:hypothetical protein